jgi:L-asparaginase
MTGHCVRLGTPQRTPDFILMSRPFCPWKRMQVDLQSIASGGDSNERQSRHLVMNDWIHGARSLTRPSTTAVQTFMSPVRDLVGVANYRKNDFYSKPEWKHATQTEIDIRNVMRRPRVDIIFASVDMSPDLIDAAVASGARGIVIRGSR